MDPFREAAYDKKYFNNIRDAQWVPYARSICNGVKTNMLDFYKNNQAFIEQYKKVNELVHMAYIYRMYQPQLCEIYDSVEDKYITEEIATPKFDMILHEHFV